MPDRSSNRDDDATTRLVEELAFRCLEDRDPDGALERATADHPELEDRVRNILEALRARGLVDSPPRPTPETTGDAIDDASDDAPDRIGDYQILERLGEGGMGTVYLAQQDTPVRRRVALKLVKLGMDSKAVLRRFEVERKAIAVMNHDNVARVFDVGTTTSGRPYFVMEYVPGVPVTEYCDRERLSLEARIRLFQKICAGVQHAHHKGVIHRDLKPANVLVTEAQGEPVPKIIDFGLARATDQGELESSIVTEHGQLLGTPEYMAPEQADRTLADIDTRADVYSLGALLYEMLTGVLPFGGELRRAGLLEVQRVIKEVDPPRPSARAAPSEATTSDSAQLRSTTPRALLRALRSDLDWVVLKAMDKDPDRRYASANELALDLGRYLAHEPLVAGPPSTGYRLRKLLRRYRGQAVAASVVFVALVGGLAAALWQAGEAAARLADYRRMADARRLQDLEREADVELWPATLAIAPAMEDWVRRAEEVVSRFELHGRKLAELRARALPYTGEMRDRDRRSHPAANEVFGWQQRAAVLERERDTLRAALHDDAETDPDAGRRIDEIEAELAGIRSTIAATLARIDRDRSYTFDDAEDTWQHDVIGGLVRGIEALRNPRTGRLVAVRQRLRDARTLEESSVGGPEAQRAWLETTAAIRRSDGERASGRYDGMELEPQLGLLPIGADPDSLLWEFAHLPSGEPATRDPDTGRLLLTERTGIVLVLIPGGRFWLGAQSSDPNGPNYDPHAQSRESDNDGNPVEVALDPFFLSKFEMTQAQWRRVARENPSLLRSAPSRSGPGQVTPMHPVENARFAECVEMLRRLDLVLPSEAQWEYAARAGTTTPWWCGDKSSLSEAGNVADSFTVGRLAGKLLYDADLDDGFAIHAPVGSLRANPFGIHDVAGNVWEFCQDGFVPYDVAGRPGDGLRPVAAVSAARMMRGGSYQNVATSARSAYRGYAGSETRNYAIGCRPARKVRP